MTRDKDLWKNATFPDHSLSSSQLAVLSSICDTVFPSISPHGAVLDSNPLNQSIHKLRNSETRSNASEAVELFFKTSASWNDIPAKLARIMHYRLKKSATLPLGIFLWLLSTRAGTLLLAGKNSLRNEFPFISAFSDLPYKNREAALISWSRSFLLPLRTISKVFRSLSMAVLFTDLDENGVNLLWKGIGYPGPDPARPLVNKSQLTDNPKAPAGNCPLETSVIHLNSLGDHPGEALSGEGLTVLRERNLTQGLLEASEPGEEEPTVIECDAVIIGSGSGGAVVAARLAERGISRVLVLEKGAFFGGAELSLLEGPTFNAMYDNGGILSTEDGSISVLAGSTVGGGSRINWAASLTTPKHVRKEWAEEYGLTRYTSPEFESATKAVCERLQVHSTGTEHGLSNSVILRGCKKLGYPVSEIPRNAPGPHNCNWCALGCWKGEKQSTADTWLPDAVTGGANVLAECQVEKVLLRPNLKQTLAEGNMGEERPLTTCGVLAHFFGGKKKARTLIVESPVVVVAAGSIHTPAILLRSGLKNPNIGKTLRLHPVSALWGYIPPSLENGLDLQVDSCQGPIMSAHSTVCANWDSHGYGALIQTPWAHPGLAASACAWNGGREFKSLISKFSRLAFLHVLTRDRGFGSVKIDSEGKPAIFYDMCEEDKAHLIEGLKHGARILKAAGVAEIGTTQTEVRKFDCETESDEQFEGFLRRIESAGVKKCSVGLFSAHQTGSCRMGISPLSSAVDPEGETWEAENLYLGDGSVLATPPGVNPMITIQSVAYCIGDNLAKKLKP